ncbi:hypothetical protein ACHAPU_010160 [Fusarium lateritium]
MRSSRSNVWCITTTGKTLDKEKFLDRMEKPWNKWACYHLSGEETRAWKAITEMICTTDIQTIDDMATPEYWAEITALKVLFRREFLLSRHAAVAQNKFPKADLNQWKPNEKGPTKGSTFQNNKYMLQKRHDSMNEPNSNRLQMTLAKRPWCSKIGDGIDEESPRKRPRLVNSHSLGETDPESKDNHREGFSFRSDADKFNEAEYTEELNEFETQLASIRKAAEENTQISPQAIDSLLHAYHDERKKERKAQDEEISTLRTMYESVVSTFIKGSIDGMKALRIVRRDVSKRKKNKKQGQ